MLNKATVRNTQDMKKFLPIAMLLMTGALVAPSAKADMTSRMTSSVQLQVNAAATQMQRIGSSFSITDDLNSRWV